MAPSLPQFSAARFRSYIFRLPLFTRSIIFVIVLLWVAGMQSVWDVQAWGALIPNEIGLASSMLLLLAFLPNSLFFFFFFFWK
jgi:glycosylphosphatidylinositol transamidase